MTVTCSTGGAQSLPQSYYGVCQASDRPRRWHERVYKHVERDAPARVKEVSRGWPLCLPRTVTEPKISYSTIYMVRGVAACQWSAVCGMHADVRASLICTSYMHPAGPVICRTKSTAASAAPYNQRLLPLAVCLLHPLQPTLDQQAGNPPPHLALLHPTVLVNHLSHTPAADHPALAYQRLAIVARRADRQMERVRGTCRARCCALARFGRGGCTRRGGWQKR